MADEILKTIKSAGGDYTSLAAWESDMQANIVTADQYHIAECYTLAGADSACQIGGWTTDATRYIKVYTPLAERHDGKWNASKYRISSSSNVLTCGERDIKIDGLQLENTSSSTSDRSLLLTNPGSGSVALYEYSNNVLRCQNATSGERQGIMFTSSGNAGSVANIWNNVIYDGTTGNSASAGINHTTDGDVTVNAYNNTILNFYHGIDASEPFKTINNIAQDCTDGFAHTGAWEGGSDYNLSDIAADAPGGNSVEATLDFVNKGADDFHLAAGDSEAINAGIGPGSDAAVSVTDIDGDTRSGATCDIGADEIPAAPAGGLPPTLCLLGAGI